MALQSLGSGGFVAFPQIGVEGITVIATANSTLDAAGESVAMIGQIAWSDGGSHTVSSAGGKIYWSSGAVTFANAGTTIRVGIQDVASTGIEDATFDVSDDLVGGTDTIAANSIITTTMASGSKTIAHDALIAVVLEVISRGGADSVIVHRATLASGFPNTTADSGSGPTRSTGTVPYILVEADDGTLGVIGGYSYTIPHLRTTTSYTSASTPDEYALVFQVPFRCTINALLAIIGDFDSSDAAELILYSDPLGTPVAQRTVTVNEQNQSQPSASAVAGRYAITAYTLEPGTNYAVGFRPTTGTLALTRITTVPVAGVRQFSIFGTTLQGGTRSDNTGAFSTSTTDWPLLGVVINQLDDGAGTGSAGGGPLVGSRLIQ